MQTTSITTGAVAAALALSAAAAFAADSANYGRADSGQEGKQAIVGKLFSLSDYLGQDSQSRIHGSSTTNASPFSQHPAGSDAKQPGRQAGKPGGLVGDRSVSTTSGARDQRGTQGSQVGGRADSSLHSLGSGSASEQTLVLIAQHGNTRSVRTQPAGLTSPTLSQGAQVQFASEQRNSAGTSGLSSGGQAYVLVFGDDASSQAAYLKAKGMVTDGSSNWSGAKGGSGDRTAGTGQYDAHSGAFRGVAGSEPGEQPSTTGRAGPQDQEGKWSKTGSQVRVTGVLVSRGGIEAIRVSEITVDGSLTDPTGKTVGSGDRTRASGKSDNTSGQ